MKDTFENYGIDVPAFRTGGQVKALCPQCSESRKNKTDRCLSVNIDEGIWNCKNCEWSGKLKNEDNVQKWKKEKAKKEYDVPTFYNDPLTKSGMDFMGSRGISKNTIQRFKVTGAEGKIYLNFWEAGELVYVKTRTYPEKGFKAQPGCRVIPYNVDAIKEAEGSVLLITEGEMDTLTAYECVLDSRVISVPNGAQGTGWMDDYYDDLNKVKSFIIATDGDEKGVKYREELGRRLGKHKCKYVEYPEGTKDLNEVMLNYSIEDVKACISGAVEFPIEGMVTRDEVIDEIALLEAYGYPVGEKIGYMYLDHLFSVIPGELTTITGTPGSGKSEIVDAITMKLAKKSAAKESHYDWKIASISFENQPTARVHVPKLIGKYHGKDFLMCDSKEKMEAIDFIMGRFKFLKLSMNDLSLAGIIKKCTELIFRYGVNCVVIDPYNRLEHKRGGLNEHEYVNVFLNELIAFLQSFQVHVFLVAHPKKMQKMVGGNGNYEVAGMYDISGSSHFYNMTDNGLSAWRDFNSNLVDIHVQKIRFPWIGQQGVASFEYDKQLKTYKSIESSVPLVTGYANPEIGELVDFTVPKNDDSRYKLDPHLFGGMDFTKQ